MDLTWQLGLTALALLAGGFVKGATSLGLPLVSMPLVASIFDTRTAILILSVPLVVADLVWIGKERAHFRESQRFLGLILFAVAGVFIGARLLVRLDVALLGLILGLLTLFFVLSAGFGFRLRIPDPVIPVASPLVGLAAGILRGVAGASAPIVAIYLYSSGISRHLFGFLFNILYIIIDATMVVALARLGVYTSETLIFTVAAVAPVLAGLYLGLRLQSRFAEETFMRCVLAVLGAASLNLILIGLGIPIF